MASSAPARSASSRAKTESARDVLLTPAIGEDGSCLTAETIARSPRSRTRAGGGAYGHAWIRSVSSAAPATDALRVGTSPHGPLIGIASPAGWSPAPAV